MAPSHALKQYEETTIIILYDVMKHEAISVLTIRLANKKLWLFTTARKPSTQTQQVQIHVDSFNGYVTTRLVSQGRLCMMKIQDSYKGKCMKII